jgi:hypothetical protein
MPTYLVGPSRTYTTIQAAVAAIPTNLSGTGIHDVVIDAGTYTITSTIDLTSLFNYTTSDYVHIRCAVGSEHNGSFSGGVIVNKTNANHAFNLCRHTRVTGIVVIADAVNGRGLGCSDLSIYFTNVIVRTGVNGTGFSTSNQGGVTWTSCLSVSAGGGSSACYSFGGSGCFLYNCGGYTEAGQAPYYAPSAPSGGAFINCWGIRIGGGNCWSVSTTTGSSFNASSGTDAPGSNSINSIDVGGAGFNDTASSDFHISRYSRYYRTGTDLSTTFTQDFDNETIVNWSIGPDAQVDDTACQGDVWTTAPTSTSSPWSQGRGSTSISSGILQLNANTRVDRTSLNGLGAGNRGWVATFQARVAVAGACLYLYHGGTTPTATPGLWQFGNGSIQLHGIELTGETSQVFGATSGPISGATSASFVTLTFYWKQTLNQLAAVATFNGVNYRSGFVTISAANNMSSSRINLISRATAVGGVNTYTGPITWRADMTDAQVQYVYDGQVSLCGDLIPPREQYTASKPWRGTIENIKKQPEAKNPKLRLQKPERAPKTSSATIPKVPNPVMDIKAPKGYKNGFLAILPETGGYAGVMGVGTGNKVTLISDGLTTGKKFQDKLLLGMERAGASRSIFPIEPRGKFTQELRSNDSIPLFMSHFQNRIGTTPAVGTTYYEFYPSRERLVDGGSSFGTGSYTSSAARNTFTVSVVKAVAGSAYHFKSGVCDKLGFSFSPGQSVTVESEFAFGTVSMAGTSSGTPYGEYSTLAPYYGWNCNINFLGLNLTGFSFAGNNNITKVSPVGTNTRYYRFGQYEVQGQAEVDLPPSALSYINNSLGGSCFTIYGTLQNNARDRIIFQLGSCYLDKVEYSLKDNRMLMPFHSYESNDGLVPPLKLMVWTRNYSATTFAPN